ncbi:MAG: hypothetical protein IPK26_00045 [Planctomycetes bacterium]|nr:hypothetical protein [Planctomycetota bacterium]
MKKRSLIVALALTASLLAQEECPPDFQAFGPTWAGPPIWGGATAILGTASAGICDDGWCLFTFDVVAAYTSLNGLSFRVCFNPPVPELCIPYDIPVDPLLPPITQALDQTFANLPVQCQKKTVITLQLLGPLGWANALQIELKCGWLGCQ